MVTTKWHRPGFLSLTLLVLAVGSPSTGIGAPIAGRASISDAQQHTARRLKPLERPQSALGLTAVAIPRRRKAEVLVSIQNTGRKALNIIGPVSWSLIPVNGGGASVGPRPVVAHVRQRLKVGPSNLYRLDAGARTPLQKLSFGTSGLPVGHPFFIFAQCGGELSASRQGPKRFWLQTPTYRILLQKGRPPIWSRAKNLMPPSQMPNSIQRGHRRGRPQHFMRPPHPPSPFPPYSAPVGSPLRVPGEIASAVAAGDIGTVEQLCVHGSRHPAPLAVAKAQAAVALLGLRGLIIRCFGRNAGAQSLRQLAGIHPAPSDFKLWASEINPQTLKVDDNRASVGLWQVMRGKPIPMPNYRVEFLRIGGRWLLDSRGTLMSLGQNAAGYRRKVVCALRQARALRDIKKALASGRIKTQAALLERLTAPAVLGTTTANAIQKLDALMRGGLGNGPAVGKSGTMPGAVAPWGLEVNEVSIRLIPAGKGLAFRAIIKNAGTRAVTLAGGPNFGWSIFGCSSKGRGLPYRRMGKADVPAGVSPGKQSVLAADGSRAAKFSIKRIFILPSRGTFYFWVTRFTKVGRVGGPVTSPVLKLVLRNGRTSRWTTVKSPPKTAGNGK
jgi:hypothetical protein